jgi:hypothetical protein
MLLLLLFTKLRNTFPFILPFRTGRHMSQAHQTCHTHWTWAVSWTFLSCVMQNVCNTLVTWFWLIIWVAAKESSIQKHSLNPWWLDLRPRMKRIMSNKHPKLERTWSRLLPRAGSDAMRMKISTRKFQRWTWYKALCDVSLLLGVKIYIPLVNF